ncbi:MAG: M20 family metallo-hydrolase [Calditrichaeota bacterium]|nr:M20 family metallo-hydrolase [Calditrichota bacterium]
MISKQAFETVRRKLDELREEMVRFQQAITAIPALAPENGGEGEWDRALFIKDYLKKIGLTDIQQIDAPDPRAKEGKRPNLIARLPGKHSHKTVWIMAHMDVVPEGDRGLWETDPWQVVVKDGKIYGRGTEDNQQGLTSAIFTAKAFLETGISPYFDLGLVLVADEETGSEYGLQYLLKHHPDLFKKEDIIIVPDAGEPTSDMIEVAEKAIVWLKFVTKGKQCHASLPGHGINAFKAASYLMVELDTLYQQFNARNEMFEPPISTFEPTQKEPNVQNVNTIPGEDVFYLDCRLLPEYSVDELLTAIRQICDGIEKRFGVTITFEPVQLLEAAPPTPPDAEVVKRLQRAIQEVYGVTATPRGIGGGTVAAFFRKAGLPVAVWSTLDDMCHQPNEYAVIDYMVNDAKVFAHVALQEA